jgi:hypothetical protein
MVSIASLLTQNEMRRALQGALATDATATPTTGDRS